MSPSDILDRTLGRVVRSLEHGKCLAALAIITLACPLIGSWSHAACTDQFSEAHLEQHNYYRGVHGVPPLSADDKLVKYAQNWADTLAAEGKFEHSKDNSYGENLWMSHQGGIVDPDMQVPGEQPVQGWYSEIILYKSFGSEPDISQHPWAHFTMLIWKGVERLGVGCGEKSGNFVVVTEYEPMGNIQYQFADNVLHPIA